MSNHTNTGENSYLIAPLRTTEGAERLAGSEAVLLSLAAVGPWRWGREGNARWGAPCKSQHGASQSRAARGGGALCVPACRQGSSGAARLCVAGQVMCGRGWFRKGQGREGVKAREVVVWGPG